MLSFAFFFFFFFGGVVCCNLWLCDEPFFNLCLHITKNCYSVAYYQLWHLIDCSLWYNFVLLFVVIHFIFWYHPFFFFFFFTDVHIFSGAISPVCRWKLPFSCFSPKFRFSSLWCFFKICSLYFHDYFWLL